MKLPHLYYKRRILLAQLFIVLFTVGVEVVDVLTLKCSILIPPQKCEYQVDHFLAFRVELCHKVLVHDDPEISGTFLWKVALAFLQILPLCLVLLQVPFDCFRPKENFLLLLQQLRVHWVSDPQLRCIARRGSGSCSCSINRT